jgi:hypothetical protein
VAQLVGCGLRGGVLKRTSNHHTSCVQKEAERAIEQSDLSASRGLCALGKALAMGRRRAKGAPKDARTVRTPICTLDCFLARLGCCRCLSCRQLWLVLLAADQHVQLLRKQVTRSITAVSLHSAGGCARVMSRTALRGFHLRKRHPPKLFSELTRALMRRFNGRRMRCVLWRVETWTSLPG